VTRRGRILGTLLLERGYLDQAALDRALARQRRTGERLGEALLHLELVEEEDLYETLAFQLNLPFRGPPLTPDAAALQRVRPAFARRRRVLPLRVEDRKVQVALTDPLDLETMDDLQFQCGGRIQAVVAPPSAIRAALARAPWTQEIRPGDQADEEACPPGERDGEARPTGDGDDVVDPEAPGDLDAPDVSGVPRTPDSSDALRSPRSTPPGSSPGPRAPRVVDRLIREAAERGASDLHLEPAGSGVQVRERIDGILRPIPRLPRVTGAALLSRIKVLGGMDIAVKLRPQDGGFTLELQDRSLGIRVSTLPVQGGEKAVLRILNSDEAPSGLEDLGMVGDPLRRLRRMLKGGGGVILTAGPTGSGKSSTLSAAIAELDREGLNVVTLEDPVEYRLAGVSQVQMHPRAGLTFPAALRAVLRQDPDVVMVGEIRDRETAEIAMAAAVTGHLVLSTIHTIDAPSGITRLLHMGVPPYLVAGGLAGIVAQRLVRRTCTSCGGRPRGCRRCPDGYLGRTGIFQVLVVTEALREEIVRGGSTSVLRRRARMAGMAAMVDDARRKVAEGITSPHEVARVLREEPGEALPCRRCEEAVPPEALGCPHCGHPTVRRCRCGERLREGWRFCPACRRQAPPSPDAPPPG